jgi:hypothetical protein
MEGFVLRSGVVVAATALLLAACGSGHGGADTGHRSGSTAATRSAQPDADALCTDPGVAATPAPAGPPPRRRTVAIVRERGVYVGRAAGSRLRRITRIPGFEFQPEWSPDGRWLLLRVDGNRPDDPRGGVHIVSADGPRAQRPVGGEDFDLSVITLGERAPRPLTRGPDGDNWPEWSPDGRTIAFSRNDSELWLMSADGGLRGA